MYVCMADQDRANEDITSLGITLRGALYLTDDRGQLAIMFSHLSLPNCRVWWLSGRVQCLPFGGSQV